jgi:hypothetical protein
VNPLDTPFEERLKRLQRQRDLALRGYERNRMSPQLAEALRAEIRAALDADGQPFDVNVARRVYDLAIAAKDMCVAATSGVAEAIKTIKDTDGPMESLDNPDTPESQVQASETFGARLIREVMAMLPTLQQRPNGNSTDPKKLVHALAEARLRGMTDVAEELEVKLFGRALPGPKPIAAVIEVASGSFEHGFADGKVMAPVQRADSPAYKAGYQEGLKVRYHDPSTVPIGALDVGPRCEEKGQCEDVDGSGACFGCGRWLGDDASDEDAEAEARLQRYGSTMHAADSAEYARIGPLTRPNGTRLADDGNVSRHDDTELRGRPSNHVPMDPIEREELEGK